MNTDRFVKLAGSAAESLLFARMRGHEELGRPFEFELDLLSEDASFDLGALLGEVLTIRVDLPSGETRFFSGHVVKFWLAGTEGRYTQYKATVQPWLALLRRRVNSRIFQAMTVPAIVEQMCGEYDFASYEMRLHGSYRTWEYLVQYRESDFNFISRILEQEGIYYFFTHEDGKHTMVLADAPESHSVAPGCEKVPYRISNTSLVAAECIDTWSATRRVVPTSYVVKDFNFTMPKANLLRRQQVPANGVQAALEIFDYPGGYAQGTEGEAEAAIRLEEQRADSAVFAGAGGARGLSTGSMFALEGHPREDQNQEYLLTSCGYDIAVPPYESGVGEAARYRCAFSAVRSKASFRPARTTPKPRIEGPQTAIVAGPSNEEIWTDRYGRVKLQFHWDRYGRANETSSCWVRVAQLWAGANWGAMYLPRVGQEVIVEFLEGDPDRPLVTGRVYNGANMPPFELPAHQTQSGVKSRSTTGGTLANANEIRFEDAKGREELFVQAERDQVTLVKANQTVTIGANRTRAVGANESVAIGANQRIAVGATRTTTVAKRETQTFQDERITTVAKTDDVTIQERHTGTYHRGRVVHVDGANEELTVSGADKNTTVHGEYNVVADTHFRVAQNSDRLLMEDKFELTSVGSITLRNGDCEIKMKDGEITLTAASKISLQCGQAAIILTQDGTIEIAGANAVVLSGGQAAVELDASAAAVSGPKVTIAGAGMTEITGGVVKVN